MAKKNGVRVLVFDSFVGKGRGGRLCTLVATQTSENLFESGGWPEKITQRSGWTALYRIRSIPVPTPWGLSVNRIEQILDKL
jgi:hypothetical protein